MVFRKMLMKLFIHPQAFKQMIANTKILKDLLDCKIIDEEGSPIKNIKHTCQGFLKI